MDEKQVVDMYFAAALISYGLRYLRIDRTNVNRQKFVFPNTELEVLIDDEEFSSPTWQTLPIDQLEAHYHSQTLMYPGRFPECVKEIKNSIRAYRN